MAGKLPREGEIGAPGRLEGRKRGWLAAVIGMIHEVGENLEALPRDLGDQILAPGEMAVDGGGRHTRRLRRLGEGEALRPLRRDQLQRRIDQRLSAGCRGGSLV